MDHETLGVAAKINGALKMFELFKPFKSFKQFKSLTHQPSDGLTVPTT